MPPTVYVPRVTTDGATEPLLSARQLEVLALVARGRSTDFIAVELFLSPNTVRSHVRNILRSLGARNRPHAVAIAIAAGLIPIDEARATDAMVPPQWVLSTDRRSD